MSEEGFFRRWSRLKSQGAHPDAGAVPAQAVDAAAPMHQPDLPALQPLSQDTPHPPVGPAVPHGAPERALPTLDDVALLTSESDFSAFVTQGVDKTVQRLAMKKLFSDPHFHVMDGLDIYIDDYNKADPLPEAVLASLQHAKSMFSQLIQDDEPAREDDPPPAGRNDPPAEPPPQGSA